LLKIRRISKYFGKGTVNEVAAIRNLSLEVRPGEFVCVIGSNGAGKTTLLNCVSGTIIPDEGEVLLDGRDVTRWPEHERAALIGRVFQDPLSGTCASMSIEENLALANRRGKRRTLARGLKSAERALFAQILGKLDLGLEVRLGDPAGLLSGGQRQALTLVMATLQRPTLLLLDEHTAALDPKTAGLIMDLTLELVERDKLTTFMITHNMQQALNYGDRLVMIHNGEIILDLGRTEKERLTVGDLLDHFNESKNGLGGVLNDRLVLG
jgi:putative ABC transport system ATP-binding protein